MASGGSRFWQPLVGGAAGSRADETTPPFSALVLLCEKCKAARRGPSSSDARRHLKKVHGKARQLRVLEVQCLKLCPDRGVAACVVDVQQPEVTMRVLRSADDLDALTRELARRA